MLLHATTIALNNRSVLITGASGTGKSDLALRLIMEHGAVLVSDDQTELAVKNGALVASPPDALKELMEVRHVGLLRMPYVSEVPVALYIELVAQGTPIPRLPAEGDVITLLDKPVRLLRLPAFAASTAAKIRAALMFEDVGC